MAITIIICMCIYIYIYIYTYNIIYIYIYTHTRPSCGSSRCCGSFASWARSDIIISNYE